MLHAFAVGAAALAGERETNTLFFLDMMPVGRSMLWTSKVSFALVTTLVLTLALTLLGAMSSVDYNSAQYPLGTLAAGFGVVLFEGIAWSLLWSVILDSALQAAALGLLSVGVINIGLSRSVNIGDPAVLAPAAPLRLALAAMALGLSWILFTRRPRSLGGHPIDEDISAPGRSRCARRAPPFGSIRDAVGPAGLGNRAGLVADLARARGSRDRDSGRGGPGRGGLRHELAVVPVRYPGQRAGRSERLRRHEPEAKLSISPPARSPARNGLVGPARGLGARDIPDHDRGSDHPGPLRVPWTRTAGDPDQCVLALLPDRRWVRRRHSLRPGPAAEHHGLGRGKPGLRPGGDAPGRPGGCQPDSDRGPGASSRRWSWPSRGPGPATG